MFVTPFLIIFALSVNSRVYGAEPSVFKPSSYFARLNQTATRNSVSSDALRKCQIEVTNPSPEEIVKSPLIVQGKADMSWMRGGSFEVSIYQNGYLLGKTRAREDTRYEGDYPIDYPIGGLIPFRAVLDFKEPKLEGRGELVLTKTNPNNPDEMDDRMKRPIFIICQRKIPVQFIGRSESGHPEVSTSVLKPSTSKVKKEIKSAPVPSSNVLTN